MIEQTIQRKYMVGFRNLKKTAAHKAPVILGFYVFQILISMMAGYYVMQNFGPSKYIVLPIILFFMATRYRGLNNIIHECTHFTFSEDKAQNFTLGSIAAALIFASYTTYRDEHLTHHAHLGDFEQDLDFKHRKIFGFDRDLTPSMILRHILTPVLGLHMRHYFGLDLSARDGRAYQVLKLGILAATAIAFYIDPIATSLLIIIPFAWIFSSVNYWTDCVDHAGVITKSDALEQSRNISIPKWLRVILFPRNDSFHLIHHLFPGIPSRHYDAAHEVLMEDARYRENSVSGNTNEGGTVLA